MRSTSLPSWTWHLLVWVAYLTVMVWLFSQFREAHLALLRGVLLIGTQAGLFYLNSEKLMPELLGKKRVVLYGVSVLIFLLLYQLVNFWVDHWSIFDVEVREILRRRRLPGPPPEFPSLNLRRLGRFLVTSLPAIAVLFVSSIYYFSRERRAREQREMQLQNQRLEAEMQFLRSQINPHFLFNALNNIYSLTQTASPKAPEMLLRLSELLRYVLYDSAGQVVQVGQEVTYIRSFIALQLLKDQNITQVSFETRGLNQSRDLVPLLLLPFVENAFKHSKIETDPQGFIQIELKDKGPELIFRCSNSKPKIPDVKDATGGVGLANVKRRLELRYPQQHQLHIEATATVFSIELKLMV